MRRATCLLAIVFMTPMGRAALAQSDDPVRRELPPVEVIHRTPLPGFDMPASQYPANAQQADDARLERAGAANLPDFLQRRFAGVSGADVQGNPFQPDLSYRGQRLSPLLGTAQGLSVWLDGVRMNAPLGDVVGWDLLPESALAEVALVPGSNGLYGLNTIAGSLVLATKSGLTHPGTEAEVSAGSAGRLRVDASQGWRAADGRHAYVSASRWHDGGWRRRSRSDLGNVFLKAGRQQGEDGWSASLLAAGSRLAGNGLLPEALYALDRGAYYTAPDTTRNTDLLGTLRATFGVGATRFTAIGWHRAGRRDGTTGDIAGDSGADPGAAVFNRGTARQQDAGLALQATRPLGAAQLGAGIDGNTQRVRFVQTAQEATFDAARLAHPLDGPEELAASLDGRVSRLGGFVAADAPLDARTHVNGSLRWDHTRTRNALGPGGPARESFRYRTFSPALGATRALGPSLSLFANASQGARVPTALELGCADPARPCVLATGLQSDPYLKPVVARTLELGLRGADGGRLQWSAALFRTDSRDDIVFARADASQAGYFTNVGRTLRRGLELQLSRRRGAIEWEAGVTWLRATYASPLVLPGPLSTAAQPNTVMPGSPLAGLPRRTAKLAADWRFAPDWRFGVDAQAVGSQAVAGNEGGTRPELGRLPGHGVLNANLRWQATPRLQAVLRVANLLDRRYAGFAAGNLDLFPAGRPLQPGHEAAPVRFLAPGAPRLLAAGLRYEWGP